MSTLILLGGAGGLLREVLDVYTQFLDWQTDRRTHRKTGIASDPPQFREYSDGLAVATVAALLHCGLGAAAAVLLGNTGQISGAYAAIAVGLSAPALLTQLSRSQSVSDALTGEQPPTPAAEATTLSAETPQTPPVPTSWMSGSLPSARAEGSVGCVQPEPAQEAGLNGQPVAAADSSATLGGGSARRSPCTERPPQRPGQFGREEERT
ncbi:hypothetical protein ACFYZ2_11285 [Streptomyces sviceus]|uniref:hypothetical protein n=1 Tax=Streptomyces sviceus TaxID=285530 RepID=UPI00367994B2